MNIQTPIENIQSHILNMKIEAKANEWDVEKTLLELSQGLDVLDLISDGLPDDPRVSNALNSVHDMLTKVYSDLNSQLM